MKKLIHASTFVKTEIKTCRSCYTWNTQTYGLVSFHLFCLQNLFIPIPIKLEKSRSIFKHHFPVFKKKNVMKVLVTFSEALQSGNMLDSAFSGEEDFTRVCLEKNDLTNKYGISEVYSELCQTSKMKLFAKIFNDFQLFIYFHKKLDFRCLVGFWILIRISYFIPLNGNKETRITPYFWLVYKMVLILWSYEKTWERCVRALRQPPFSETESHKTKLPFCFFTIPKIFSDYHQN